MPPLFIPPPPFGSFQLGPFTLHIYSLTMITAIGLAWWWSGKRIVSRGGSRDMWDSMAFIAVIFGIIGARAYHVITEHARYFGPGRDPWDALKIWHGGLGVIGSIIGGGLAVLVFCLVKHVRFSAIADCVAPTLLAAQAWGRVGNWFNQEAFGKPTTVPWALEVDPAYRPAGYQQFATFHPTFLYEGVWNLLGIAVLILVLERRLHFGKGELLVSYVLWYTFGRFFIELIRIDPVNTIHGIRINDLTGGVIFLVALAALVWLLKFRPGTEEYPFGVPDDEDEDADEPDPGTMFFDDDAEESTPTTRRRRRGERSVVAEEEDADEPDPGTMFFDDDAEESTPDSSPEAAGETDGAPAGDAPVTEERAAQNTQADVTERAQANVTEDAEADVTEDAEAPEETTPDGDLGAVEPAPKPIAKSVRKR